jgi:hypothetical protein
MGPDATVLRVKLCDLCDGPSARLNTVPAKQRPSDQAPQSVCYFCYVRVVGIKPYRRQIVPEEGSSG